MKKDKTTIILIFVLIIGLSLLLYPSVSDYWNSFHQTRSINEYKGDAEKIRPEETVKMLEEAEEYNKSLVGKVYPWSLTEEERARYENILDVTGTGIIGYVDIPAADIFLPVYHGTDDVVLANGAGHVECSSFPIGGESTHAIILGHRGLPSAKLFTDLDKLVEGDKFQITVLDNVVSYEVDKISIVLPEDMSQLGIVEGEDYCTLVTCTPYGINTHRLLIRGHRISNALYSADNLSAEAFRLRPIVIAPLVAIPMLIVLLIILLVTTRNKNKKKKGSEEK